jgi:PEP-CTERM motif
LEPLEGGTGFTSIHCEQELRMPRNPRTSTSTQESKAVRLRWAAAAAAAALAVAAAPASADVVYNESVSGDLSNNGLAPTPIAFVNGDNIVTGTTGHDVTGAIDRDYFTFTIGADQNLTAINILLGTQTIGASFIGLQAGSQVTLPVFPANATGLLGWAHYTGAEVGTDILDNMSVSTNGASGFSTPLGPGTYSVWLQEISPGGAVPYSFDFVVSQVPEPSSWAMLLAGFAVLGLAFRRRRRLAFARA